MNVVQSVEEENDNDDIDSNLLDDSNNGLVQAKDYRGVPGDPVSYLLEEWE